MVGLSIIVVGGLTWVGSIRTIKPGLMALVSLFLVAIGAATVMWTLHLGLVTGDMEYYMFMYGGSLMAQGASSLLGYSGTSENMTVA
jgi:hypothetical protein